MGDQSRGVKRRRPSAEEINRMSHDEMREALTACVTELEAFDEMDVDTMGAGGESEGPTTGATATGATATAADPSRAEVHASGESGQA